ncbi:MAG: hypothetical protein ACLT0Y_07245 [Christensenellales bacterium]
MTSYTHTSVLLMQSVDALSLSPGCIAVDGPSGWRHSEEMLKRVRPNGMLIGIDRDKTLTKAPPIGRFMVHDNFFISKRYCAPTAFQVDAFDGPGGFSISWMSRWGSSARCAAGYAHG